jgi:hypothetical protein
VIGENGTPDTPDWTLPPRADGSAEVVLTVPANIELGSE